MNRTQTLATALLFASLPFAQSALADGRDRDDYDGRRSHAEDRHHGHGYGHDRDHRRHYDRGHYGHYRHHGHHARHGGYGWRHDHGRHYGHYDSHDRGYRPTVVAPRLVLPLPLPPVPMIVIKKHHDAKIVLRHPY